MSGDYFMVGHCDLGTSLVSAENLLTDHKSFQKKAEVCECNAYCIYTGLSLSVIAHH